MAIIHGNVFQVFIPLFFAIENALIHHHQILKKTTSKEITRVLLNLSGTGPAFTGPASHGEEQAHVWQRSAQPNPLCRAPVCLSGLRQGLVASCAPEEEGIAPTLRSLPSTQSEYHAHTLDRVPRHAVYSICLVGGHYLWKDLIDSLFNLGLRHPSRYLDVICASRSTTPSLKIECGASGSSTASSALVSSGRSCPVTVPNPHGLFHMYVYHWPAVVFLPGDLAAWIWALRAIGADLWWSRLKSCLHSREG